MFDQIKLYDCEWACHSLNVGLFEMTSIVPWGRGGKGGRGGVEGVEEG